MRKFLFQGLLRKPLTERAPSPDEGPLKELGESLARAARERLGRSLSSPQVDAGSCNGCELEIHALNNAFYDFERFGLHFVASPTFDSWELRFLDLPLHGPSLSLDQLQLGQSRQVADMVDTLRRALTGKLVIFAEERWKLGLSDSEPAIISPFPIISGRISFDKWRRARQSRSQN